MVSLLALRVLLLGIWAVVGAGVCVCVRWGGEGLLEDLSHILPCNGGRCLSPVLPVSVRCIIP